MKYQVMEDTHITEFDKLLTAGEIIEDSDLESDLVAKLVSNKVIEPIEPKVNRVQKRAASTKKK